MNLQTQRTWIIKKKKIVITHRASINLFGFEGKVSIKAQRIDMVPKQQTAKGANETVTE